MANATYAGYSMQLAGLFEASGPKAIEFLAYRRVPIALVVLLEQQANDGFEIRVQATGEYISLEFGPLAVTARDDASRLGCVAIDSRTNTWGWCHPKPAVPTIQELAGAFKQFKQQFDSALDYGMPDEDE